MNLNRRRSVRKRLIYKTRNLAERSPAKMETLPVRRHADIYTCTERRDL